MFFFEKKQHRPSFELLHESCSAHDDLCVCVCSLMPKHEYYLRIHGRVCATFYETAALLACVHNVHIRSTVVYSRILALQSCMIILSLSKERKTENCRYSYNND